MFSVDYFIIKKERMFCKVIMKLLVCRKRKKNILTFEYSKSSKNRRNEKKERRAGILLVTVVLLATGAVSGLLLWGAYAIAPVAGCILESIMTYQILATKCLKVESMKVYERLRADDLAGARNAVAMIVGRDTQNLDAAGVAKAAVETVAENTSDGVIAPMICLAIGGPVLGFLYKAVNTMDSMVGYKNERYLNFGRTAAKLDDVVNYIPARICPARSMIRSSSSPSRSSARMVWPVSVLSRTFRRGQ